MALLLRNRSKKAFESDQILKMLWKNVMNKLIHWLRAEAPESQNKILSDYAIETNCPVSVVKIQEIEIYGMDIH